MILYETVVSACQRHRLKLSVNASHQAPRPDRPGAENKLL